MTIALIYISEIFKLNVEGFNTCILGYGQSDSGCSKTILGTADYSSVSAVECKREDSSFLYNYLKEAFMYKEYVTISKKKYRVGSSFTVGVSVWCLFDNEVIDLCNYKSQSNPSLHSNNSKVAPVTNEFTIIECPTLDIALQVVATARFERFKAFPNGRELLQFAHMFVRITLHSRLITGSSDECRTCSCQLVDLVGIGRNIRDMPETDAILYRRVMNSLGCFSKVVGEIREISMRSAVSSSVIDRVPAYDTSATAAPGLSRVTSARESALTKFLTPYLMGNYKCYYVLFLKDGSANHVHIRTVLGAFEHVQGSVKCTCYIEQVSPVGCVCVCVSVCVYV